MKKIINLLAFACMLVPSTVSGQVSGAAPSGMNPGRLPVIVYKTKKDYRNLVAVILNDDKSKIESYPDPHDVAAGNKKWAPVALHGGYLLDRRGINKNVAFIKLTYDQYAKMHGVARVSELYNMIVDKDPLVELWECGPKKDYPNVVKKINMMIDRKHLNGACKRMN